MKRKIWSVVLVVFVIAVLTLTGCSGARSGGSSTGAKDSAAGGSVSGGTQGKAPEKVIKVGISYLVSHPALDLTRKGAKDALTDAGFVEGKNIIYDEQNAQGDPNMAITIGQKLAASDVDAILTITTPSGQAGVKATREKPKPLIFVGVSDPIGASMLKEFGKPTGLNYSGVYNFDPVDAQMGLIAEFLPQGKKVGVIYNAGESNSVSNIKRFKEAAQKRNWQVVEATVTSSNEVQTASRTFVGKVDAVYMPQDNTVVSALEALIKTCRDNKIPLFVGDTESVKRGAIATVGNDQYDTGRQAGEMMARVLKGEKPGDIKPEVVRKRVMIVNAKAAEIMGVKVPQAVLDKAQEVIK